MNDVFTPSAFKNLELTEAINRSPYVPRRIQSMNLFQTRSVYRETVAIEYKSGRLSIIQTQPRGSRTGLRITSPKRKVRTFSIPHLPQFATITPDDLPNVRAYGTVDGRIAVNTLISERLMDMRTNLEATIEYHMMGAIKGKILDADSSTIYDLYNEFGITETEIEVDFGASVIQDIASTIHRTVAKKLGNDPYSGLHVFCGDVFFDKLKQLDELKEAYNRPREGAYLRENYTYDSFEYAGIIWENYRGEVGSLTFCEAHEARVVPMGVPQLFLRRNGPADTMDAVGQKGKPFVVTREFMPHGQGVELKGQANPLIICAKPDALIKLVETGY